MSDPTRRVPPFGTLRAFEAAARLLSFKDAAQELHVTPSAISQQIRLLEDHLGVPLFHRRIRALELTSLGAVMLPKVREGLESFAAAIAMARELEDAKAPLVVNAPPGFSRAGCCRGCGLRDRASDVDIRLRSSPR
jgi:LysR family glycine cleavage system transcriptional activator